MAKEVRFDVKVDAADAIRELKDVGRAADDSGDAMAKAFADASAKSDAAFDKVITGLKGVTDESKRMIESVKTIGDRMGEGFDPQMTAELVTSLRKAGVEFDTIDTKADDLIKTMRELDGVRVDAAANGLTNMRGRADNAGKGVDNLTASAQKSRNAMANMVGNAAQDLGALVGITGSAGVALGQLAEGAQDARNDSEGLGSVLKGVASSALPIVGVGIAVGLISSKMAAAKKKAQELDAANRRFADGLTDTIGAAQAMDAALDSAFDVGAASEAAIVARAFTDALDPTKLQDFRHALSDMSMTQVDFVAGLQNAGGTLDWFIKNQVFAATSSAEVADEVASLIENFDGYSTILGSATDETADFIRNNASLVTGLDEMQGALGGLNLEDFARNFLEAQKGTASETKAIEEAIATTNTYSDALQVYLQWKQRQNALQAQARTGLQAEKVMWDSIATATQAATDAERDRHDQLMADVAAKVLDDELTMRESITTATQDATKAQEEHTTAVQEAAIAIADVLREIPDLAGALTTELDKVDHVFEGLKFDVDFGPAMDDALGDLAGFGPDFQTLADSWADILAGKPIDIFGNVRADDAKFLEVTEKVRDLFQTGIVNEFEQGGQDAADAFVDSMAPKIAEASGLSIADVYKIMGLPPDGSIATVIEPSVDADHADKARAILDSLAGVAGDEAREARIHVALETGDIDGDIAFIASQLLAHEALGMPVDLSEFTQEDIDKAQAFLDGQTWTATIVPDVPTSELNRTDHILTQASAERTATIGTETPDADATNRRLNGVADGILGRIWPGGAGRLATYRTEAPGAGNLNTVLNAIADKPRTANIRLDTNPDVFDLNRAIDHASRNRTTVITIETHSGATISTAPSGLPGGQSVVPAGLAAGPTSTAVAMPSAVTMTAVPALPSLTANVTINTGVLGNHFDVERTITRALRRSARINGRRAVAVR